MTITKYPLDGHPSFDVREFVHPAFVKAVGIENARWFISDFQRDFAFLLREKLNVAILLNNWHVGGQNVGKGTRPRSYKPKGGGEFSQHYLARALDPSTKEFTPKQMFECIMDNEKDFRAIGLTTIEDVRSTKTWLHGDCRPILPGLYPKSGFLIVSPA